VDRPNGTRQRLQYDNANRLAATFEENGVVSLWQAGYGFDNAYRLVSYTPTPITKTLPPPPATMTYDSDNRLATYNGQSVASDSDGNLLSAPINGTLLGSVTWDARNRLTSTLSTLSPQQSTSYTYDAENRRVSSTLSGQTTTYTWSRGAKLDQLLIKINPDGSVTRYVHGLGLLYEETTPAGGGSTTTLFYHYNWQGSTVALSDSAGNVTARMSYSPYGERTVESGTVTTPFCFNGQFGVMTESNGLLCMQARFYSPIFRRFLSEDPAGFSGGINLYSYTGGDPVNLMDPFGLGPMGSLVLTGNPIIDAALEAFSRAGQGVVNAFTGGLFDPTQGLFYDSFNQQWANVGVASNEGSSDFATGTAGGQFAVATLSVAGGVWAWSAAGLPTFSAGVITSPTVHVFYGVTQGGATTWLHAAGSTGARRQP